jgi:hypothetical protein
MNNFSFIRHFITGKVSLSLDLFMGVSLKQEQLISQRLVENILRINGTLY